MNYEETMNYINSIQRLGSKLGLSSIERLLAIMGNPQDELKIIHVAGTNGKGSVANIIGKILEEQGYRVGVYTSPYLEYFEESIKINGIPINEADLSYIMTKIKGYVDEIVNKGYDSPTEFEIVTAAMFLYFKEKAVDFAVVEVGLGGRLDATNVLNPILTVITSISFDHMGILGDTLEKIAYEKAGIIKKNIPLILYPQNREAETVILNKAEEMNAPVIKVSGDYTFMELTKEDGKYYQIFKSKINESYETFYLPLLGEYQIINALTSITAADALNKAGYKISMIAVKKGVKNVIHTGRFEILKESPRVIIDGAHNMEGVNNLISSMKKYFKWNKLVLIVGMLQDKEYSAMLKAFFSISHIIICLSPKSDRALKGEDLSKLAIREGKTAVSFKDYKEAYEYGCSLLEKDDILLIAGSLYMIGDMRKIINKAIK